MALKDNAFFFTCAACAVTAAATWTVSEKLRVAPMQRAVEERQANHRSAPTIKGITVTKTVTTKGQVADQNIEFTDPEGDAIFINYVVLGTKDRRWGDASRWRRRAGWVPTGCSGCAPRADLRGHRCQPWGAVGQCCPASPPRHGFHGAGTGIRHPVGVIPPGQAAVCWIRLPVRQVAQRPSVRPGHLTRPVTVRVNPCRATWPGA